MTKGTTTYGDYAGLDTMLRGWPTPLLAEGRNTGVHVLRFFQDLRSQRLIDWLGQEMELPFTVELSDESRDEGLSYKWETVGRQLRNERYICLTGTRWFIIRIPKDCLGFIHAETCDSPREADVETFVHSQIYRSNIMQANRVLGNVDIVDWQVADIMNPQRPGERL